MKRSVLLAASILIIPALSPGAAGYARAVFEGERTEIVPQYTDSLRGGELSEVTVRAEKDRVVYKLDRQSLSSGQVLSAEGGTAIEILATDPSAVLDADGNLSLRGSSNFLVYVDGQLSPLEGSDALRSIPSSRIESIEVLTTPSARYRTDGDAAVINVITKKSAENGWSGLVGTSGSTLGSWGADFTMNYRRGRSRWYVGGTFQNLKGLSDFRQTKSTLVDDISTLSDSDGRRWKEYGTYTGRVGWQFSDGIHHKLSVEISGGQTSNWRGGDMLYLETRTDPLRSFENRYDSHDRYNLRKNFIQATLEYVWNINSRNEFALSSRFRYDPYSIEYTESNMFDSQGLRYEGTRGYEQEHHWDCDASLLYRLKYSDKGKLELGCQYTTYSEHGDYKIKYWDRQVRDFVWQEDLATPFYYRRQVYSPYAMISDTFGKFSFDAGIRADRVLDRTDIAIEGTSRDIKRFDLFPSAHLRYCTDRAGTFTLGYSYRTNRPGIWNLEPYITYEDYYTKKIGNPDIRPEYIHSAQLEWHRPFGGGHSLGVTAFFKHRRDLSDWVRIPYEPGVTLDYIVNAGSQVEGGLEVNSVLKAFKWWNVNLSGSFFRYGFKAVDPSCTDATGNTFLVGWLNTFSIKQKTRVSLDFHAVGPRALTQGDEKGYCYFELGVKRNFLKDRLAVALVGHDIFRTARYQNSRSASGLHSVTSVLPKYPSIVLSLSYNFNSSPHKNTQAQENVLFEGKDF